MKLKCDAHGRRVLSIDNSPHFLHRTGDQSKCTSDTASLTDNTSHITRKFTISTTTNEAKPFGLVEISCDKKSRPHTKHKKE